VAASHEARRGLTPLQRRQVEGARTIHTLRASVNHGVPPVAATNRPGTFAGRGVVAAKGALGTPSRPAAVAANFSGRGSSAHAVSGSAPIGATRRSVSDSRQFHAPPHPLARSVDPVRASTHMAAAPQASRTPQSITNPRNPASVPRVPAQAPMGHAFNRPAAASQYRQNPPSRVAAQAPTGYAFNRPAVPSRYRVNPPPSARSFPAQAPDRRWVAPRAPQPNAASGANFRPAREAQPAHVNDPAAQRNGRHS
jgi:hypothetical protein